jgi:hypothetical protein
MVLDRPPTIERGDIAVNDASYLKLPRFSPECNYGALGVQPVIHPHDRASFRRRCDISADRTAKSSPINESIKVAAS